MRSTGVWGRLRFMTANPPRDAHVIRTATLTALAMLAFAGNSLLCRAALAEAEIDPASFATLRTLSGAIVLAVLLLLRPRRRADGPSGSWPAAIALAVYMAGFAYAYVSLDAGTGALILFGAVQITMMTAAFASGERLLRVQWVGFALAIAGLVWLMLPGVTKPSPMGAALMAAAGAGWGVYSLRGRGVTDPLRATTANFVRATPIVAVVSVVALGSFEISAKGAALAIASGAVASGLGYTIWYAALRGLNGTRAAMVQLTVPVIAAVGGVLLLGETLTPRLVIAGLLTLGGVALAIGARARAVRPG
ncbi:MAG TPA: DMT family transporter [Steroidobacteraceae bacterium]|nr:DMT family transporter [Steroidobacteraceae bacterium]